MDNGTGSRNKKLSVGGKWLGLTTISDSTNLPLGALKEATNVVSDVGGMLRKREGFRLERTAQNASTLNNKLIYENEYLVSKNKIEKFPGNFSYSDEVPLTFNTPVANWNGQTNDWHITHLKTTSSEVKKFNDDYIVLRYEEGLTFPSKSYNLSGSSHKIFVNSLDITAELVRGADYFEVFALQMDEFYNVHIVYQDLDDFQKRGERSAFMIYRSLRPPYKDYNSSTGLQFLSGSLYDEENVLKKYKIINNKFITAPIYEGVAYSSHESEVLIQETSPTGINKLTHYPVTFTTKMFGLNKVSRVDWFFNESTNDFYEIFEDAAQNVTFVFKNGVQIFCQSDYIYNDIFKPYTHLPYKLLSFYLSDDNSLDVAMPNFQTGSNSTPQIVILSENKVRPSFLLNNIALIMTKQVYPKIIYSSKNKIVVSGLFIDSNNSNSNMIGSFVFDFLKGGTISSTQTFFETTSNYDGKILTCSQDGLCSTIDVNTLTKEHEKQIKFNHIFYYKQPHHLDFDITLRNVNSGNVRPGIKKEIIILNDIVPEEAKRNFKDISNSDLIYNYTKTSDVFNTRTRYISVYYNTIEKNAINFGFPALKEATVQRESVLAYDKFKGMLEGEIDYEKMKIKISIFDDGQEKNVFVHHNNNSNIIDEHQNVFSQDELMFIFKTNSVNEIYITSIDYDLIFTDGEDIRILRFFVSKDATYPQNTMVALLSMNDVAKRTSSFERINIGNNIFTSDPYYFDSNNSIAPVKSPGVQSEKEEFKDIFIKNDDNFIETSLTSFRPIGSFIADNNNLLGLENYYDVVWKLYVFDEKNVKKDITTTALDVSDKTTAKTIPSEMIAGKYQITLTMKQTTKNTVHNPTGWIEERSIIFSMKDFNDANLLAKNSAFIQSELKKCKYSAYINEKLVLYGNGTNQIYTSVLKEPYYFYANNVVVADSFGLKEPITSIVDFKDTKIIFTENTMMSMSGDGNYVSQSPWAILGLDKTHGSPSHNGALAIENTVSFVSKDGVYIISQLSVADKRVDLTKISMSINDLSVPFDDNILRNDELLDTKLLTINHENRMYIYYPSKKYILVYDYSNSNFNEGVWFKWTSEFLDPKFFVVINGLLTTSFENQLLVKNPKLNQHIYDTKFNSIFYRDHFKTFPVEITTRDTTLGEVDQFKKIKNITLITSNSIRGTGAIEVSATMDSQEDLKYNTEPIGWKLPDLSSGIILKQQMTTYRPYDNLYSKTFLKSKKGRLVSISLKEESDLPLEIKDIVIEVTESSAKNKKIR